MLLCEFSGLNRIFTEIPGSLNHVCEYFVIRWHACGAIHSYSVTWGLTNLKNSRLLVVTHSWNDKHDFKPWMLKVPPLPLSLLSSSSWRSSHILFHDDRWTMNSWYDGVPRPVMASKLSKKIPILDRIWYPTSKKILREAVKTLEKSSYLSSKEYLEMWKCWTKYHPIVLTIQEGFLYYHLQISKMLVKEKVKALESENER